MTVIKLKREKKHCVSVETENGKILTIDADVASDYHLRQGITLSESTRIEMMQESDFRRAKECALWYLDRAEHTERQITDKMIRAGYPMPACERAVAWLKSYGMLDDRRFAKMYVEKCASSNISSRATYSKLLEKGVSSVIAKEVLNESEQDENSKIRALIKKKYAGKLDTPEMVQKTVAALIRRGFPYSAVRDELKAYSEELMYAQEEPADQ